LRFGQYHAPTRSWRTSGQIWGVLSGVIRYRIIAMQMTWRGTGLYWGRRKVGSIVPDDRYPGMWRVLRSDGSLSDIVSHRARRVRRDDLAGDLRVRFLGCHLVHPP
jgi:hypothetical protein